MHGERAGGVWTFLVEHVGGRWLARIPAFDDIEFGDSDDPREIITAFDQLIAEATAARDDFARSQGLTAHGRERAIAHLMHLDSLVQGEWCVGQSEREAQERETRDALAALGVTGPEIDAATLTP